MTTMASASARRASIAAAILLAATLSACTGMGTKRVLFYSRSSLGVDIAAAPATFDVAIGRKEGVLEPTFANGQTLPVVASFRSDVSGFVRIFTGIALTFATSDAALGLAYTPSPAAEMIRRLHGRASGDEDRSPYDATLVVPGHTLVRANERGAPVANAKTIADLKKECKTAAEAAEKARDTGEGIAEADDACMRASLALQVAYAKQALNTAERALKDAKAGDPNLKEKTEARDEAEDLLASLKRRLTASEDPRTTTSGFLSAVDVSDLASGTSASPLFFATDSALGLRVAFDTNVPTGFALGFNRKELAIAPVTAALQDDGTYAVAMPPVLASVNSMASAQDQAAGITYQQYFATGLAAAYMSVDDGVREAFKAKLVPQEATSVAGTAFLDAMLARLYLELDRIESDPKETTARRQEAGDHKAALNGLATGVDMIGEEWTKGKLQGGTTPLIHLPIDLSNHSDAARKLSVFGTSLNASITLLQEVVANGSGYTLSVMVVDDDQATGFKIESQPCDQLQDTIRSHLATLERLKKSMVDIVGRREAKTSAFKNARKFLFGDA